MCRCLKQGVATYCDLLADVNGAQLVAAKGILVGSIENLVHKLVLQRRTRADRDGSGPASAKACYFADHSGSSAMAAHRILLLLDRNAGRHRSGLE